MSQEIIDRDSKNRDSKRKEVDKDTSKELMLLKNAASDASPKGYKKQVSLKNQKTQEFKDKLGIKIPYKG